MPLSLAHDSFRHAGVTEMAAKAEIEIDLCYAQQFQRSWEAG